MMLKIENRVKLLEVIASLTGGFEIVENKMKLKKLLEVSKEEVEAVDFRQEGDRLFWSANKDNGKEIDLVPFKEVLSKSVESFKVLHEEKQDWDESHYSTLIYILEVIESYEKPEESNQSVEGSENSQANENAQEAVA